MASREDTLSYFFTVKTNKIEWRFRAVLSNKGTSQTFLTRHPQLALGLTHVQGQSLFKNQAGCAKSLLGTGILRTFLFNRRERYPFLFPFFSFFLFPLYFTTNFEGFGRGLRDCSLQETFSRSLCSFLELHLAYLISLMVELSGIVLT